MKSLLVSVFIAVLVVGGLVGCMGKTTAELKADGYAIADTGSSIVKKAIDAGVAVYTIVKTVFEDIKDNVITVKDAVSGTSPTPEPPK